jgi:UDP-3-O-acyl-N-acetylglucosamine deacetylase
MIRGATEASAIVFGPEGPINGPLRAEDEPARHKLLDLLGDLYLLGRSLRGHILAWRTGHKDHAGFLWALRKEFEG